MYPELFKIGPFTVYSYGLMLGIAFIIASMIFSKEFVRKKLDVNYANTITLIAIFAGIAGSKIFHVFENWNEFLEDPFGMIFNPGGLTFYGGLIFSIILIWIYTKNKKISFLYVADASAPSLALAYGIGRIGCHLAGDGDYGIPTSLPWGFNYQNGIVKPSSMFRGSEIAKNFLNGIVPDSTPLHPTPLYEFFLGVIIFFILWNLRKKDWATGKLFMIYLMLSGTARFSVEFIRLNPRLFLSLSEAQIIAVVLILVGMSGYYFISKNPDRFAFKPAETIHQTKVKNKDR